MNMNIEIDTEYIEEWKNTVEKIKNNFEEKINIIDNRSSLMNHRNTSPFIDYIKEDLGEFYDNHQVQKEALDELVAGITTLLEFENQDELTAKEINN